MPRYEIGEDPCGGWYVYEKQHVQGKFFKQWMPIVWCKHFYIAKDWTEGKRICLVTNAIH